MPKLKPRYLNEAPPIPEADRLLTEFLGKAMSLEQSGNINGATEKLKEFPLFESSLRHQDIARSESVWLKSEYGPS
ncbi:MAG: hypothetical protein DBP01_04440 [gamma proteobacterium symbiont of Ctena orbiculata]|nr:MAG: hypothetical protein DBP01_04440 [gamma proteobacterium symbiont of Ctena orbiculata]